MINEPRMWVMFEFGEPALDGPIWHALSHGDPRCGARRGLGRMLHQADTIDEVHELGTEADVCVSCARSAPW